MKQQLALLFSFALCLVSLSAQVHHIETIIALRNENGEIRAVHFGLDSSATNGLDANLGEYALPGFPPSPSGLQAYLSFSDNGSGVLSYADFRPFPSPKVFADTFQLLLTPSTDASRGAVIAFNWSYPFDQNVDSIVVSDLLGGVIKRFKLDKREADTLKGNAVNLESFWIIVYYNVKTVGVADDSFASTATSSTYLCQDESLVIDPTLFGMFEDASYHLYNSTGQIVQQAALTQRIGLQGLPAGLYLLDCRDTFGHRAQIRILKD